MRESSASGKVRTFGMAVYWAAYYLLRISIVASVVALIMTHALGMGEWTINDMRVVDVGASLLKASVYISGVYTIVFRPISLLILNESSKERILARTAIDARESGIEGAEEYVAHARDYYAQMSDRAYMWIVIVHIVTGMLVIFTRDYVVGAIGNPIGDILLVIVDLNLPRIVSNGLIMDLADRCERYFSQLA